MSKRNLFDLFSQIDTDLIEDAANVKNKRMKKMEEDTFEEKSDANFVTEEYDIEAEKPSKKKYIKYTVSVATVLFIAGVAGVTFNIQMNQNKENNTLSEVSQTQAMSESAESIVSDVTDNVSAVTMAENESAAETRKGISEIIVADKSCSSETVIISKNIDEGQEESTVYRGENSLSDNQQPIHNDNESITVTEKRVVAEDVNQNETEQITTSPETESQQIHLPNISYEKPDSGYCGGEATTPEKLSEILNSLSYSIEVCDGLPPYEFTSSDGTEYYIAYDYKFVWRKNKVTGMIEEAQTTDLAIAMIKSVHELYGLNECVW